MKSISTPNIIGIVILLLFATYAIAVASKENAQYFLDKGNTLFNEHRLTEAKLAYGKALEKDPEISLAHYQLARIYFVEGKFQEAEQEITLEIALHEDNKRAFYLSGLIYSFQENFALAEQAFYEFVHAYPDSEAGNNDLAQILFVQGKFQEAEQTLLHILSFYKESFLVAQGLGAVYLELGEFTKAKQYIQSTLDTVLAMDVSTFMKYYPSLNPKYAQDGIATIREGIRYNLALAISGEQGLFNKQQVASTSFAPYFQSVSGEQRQGAVFLAASCEADFEHFSNECFDTIAPTISISISPSSSIDDQDTITFLASASDSSGIAETKIFIDENNDGNFNDNGKTCTISSCVVTTGPYEAGQTISYYATAKDAAGNFASTLPTKSFVVASSCSLATGSSCTACNNVGQCNIGSIQCNGSCSAAAPADDTQPPTISISISPSSSIDDQDTITFLASASDSSGIAETKIFIDENNDGNFNDNGKTCTISSCVVTTGPYEAGQTISYYATAKDFAGNLASTLPTKSFVVIFSPPTNVTLFASPVGSVANGTTVTYTAVTDKDISEASPYWIYIFREDSVIASCKTGKTCFRNQTNTDITYTFTAKVARADRSDVIATDSITTTWFNLDITPPTSTINGPVAGSWDNDPSFFVSVSDLDNAGGSGLSTCHYGVFNDPGGWIVPLGTQRVCGSLLNISVGSIGDCRSEGINKCQVQIYSLDNAGKQSSIAFRAFSIDYTDPIVGSVSPTSVEVGITQTFSVLVSDAQSEVRTCELLADGVEIGSMTLSSSPCTSCTASRSYTFLTSGAHTMFARCVDEVGKIGTGSDAQMPIPEKFVGLDMLSWFIQPVYAAFVNTEENLYNIGIGPVTDIIVKKEQFPQDAWQRLWYTTSGKKPAFLISNFKGEDSVESIDISKTGGTIITLSGMNYSDNIGFQARRSIFFSTAGAYRFTITSDDGVNLWIDGESISLSGDHISWQDKESGSGVYTADVNMSDGNHNFIIEWYEHTGDAYISFDYSLGVTTPSNYQCKYLNVKLSPAPDSPPISYQICNGHEEVGICYYNSSTIECAPLVTNLKFVKTCVYSSMCTLEAGEMCSSQGCSRAVECTQDFDCTEAGKNTCDTAANICISNVECTQDFDCTEAGKNTCDTAANICISNVLSMPPTARIINILPDIGYRDNFPGFGDFSALLRADDDGWSPKLYGVKVFFEDKSGLGLDTCHIEVGGISNTETCPASGSSKWLWFKVGRFGTGSDCNTSGSNMCKVKVWAIDKTGRKTEEKNLDDKDERNYKSHNFNLFLFSIDWESPIIPN